MTEVWGTLAKSQVDSQTIDEAVSAAIAAHEADASAHVDTGESLESHKAAAIIDHVIGSVMADKLTFTEIVLQTNFDSLDRWLLVGSQYGTKWPGVTLWADGYAPVLSKLTAEPVDRGLFLVYGKNSYFQASISIQETHNKLCFWGFGWISGSDVVDGYGFKVVNNSLYGYWDTSGAVQTVELSGVTLTENHVYRAQYDKTTKVVTFYVDGVVKGSITDSDTTMEDDMLIIFYNKATEAWESYLNILSLTIAIDK